MPENDAARATLDRQADVDRLGLRVARARQEARLTEKQLAHRLGLPLWRIERIQSGADDPRAHLSEIAEATGKPEAWFGVGKQRPSEALEDEAPSTTRPVERFRTAAKELRSRLNRVARLRERQGEPGDDQSGPAPLEHSLQTVGARIARARQEAGMTQKAFAKAVGLPLWRIEHFERGEEDPAGHLQALAATTGRSEEWFASSLEGVDAKANGHLPAADTTSAEISIERLAQPARRKIVLASLVLLVTIRFFTEVVHVLPRPAKLVDVPILVILAILAATVPRKRAQVDNTSRYLIPAAIFLLIALVSILANLNRVTPGPTIVFLYGFLAPIGIYAVVYHLWPTGHALSMSRLLIGLAAVQFVVVALIDLPLFLATHNPDKVSGTFGENAYQLVIYLLVVAAVVAGTYTFEPKRLAARLAPLFFVATLLTIFLAQYRAILPTMAATTLLIAVLLGFLKLRGAIASLIIVATFVLGLSYVSSLFPELKYASTVGSLASDPGLYASERLGVAGDVMNLYTDNPRYIVSGTGPGTYSSRAWYIFQPASRSKKGLGVNTSASGRGYQTDVSNKYVAPRLQRGVAKSIGGSYAAQSPFSSYTSLLAEVGVIGFMAMTLIYGGAFLQSIRMARRSLRQPAPDDPLPGLLLGCTAAFSILLQLAVLENWWEVTRLTFIFWAMLGVATKEFSARYGQATPAPLNQR